LWNKRWLKNIVGYVRVILKLERMRHIAQNIKYLLIIKMNTIEARIRQYQLETTLDEGEYGSLEEGRKICNEISDLRRMLKSDLDPPIRILK